jgi:hypothetical protein
MALHKDLTGADLHEPKGTAAAAANNVYVADGAGSGTWKKLTLSTLDLTSVQSPNTYRLTGVINDVSTPSFILIPIPVNSTFVSARMVLSGAITVADSVVSFVRNDGSSFGATVNIVQAGSAEGTGFNFTATLNQTITGPGYVKVATDGASTTAQQLFVTVTLTVIP